ncbi:DFNA5 isoform 8, partial [Pan troglodytes]
VKYEGKFANHVSGTLETALGKVKLNLGGSSRVESQSSFGTLRKQEVDLQQLIRDSAERTINLRNPVLQQVLEGRNEVLCVLTQKIMTMQKCVISEHTQVEEKCGGIVGIQTKTVQVSVTEDGNVTKDSNVVLEIPAATTIAYGVIELYVKLDGQFAPLCLPWWSCPVLLMASDECVTPPQLTESSAFSEGSKVASRTRRELTLSTWTPWSFESLHS